MELKGEKRTSRSPYMRASTTVITTAAPAAVKPTEGAIVFITNLQIPRQNLLTHTHMPESTRSRTHHKQIVLDRYQRRTQRLACTAGGWG